jgi:flagellar biosynthetic protein FliQ
MSPDHALQLLADLLLTAMLVCAPLLGSTLLAGLVVSVLQVVTQVQEMSLTFVPKLAVATFVLIVTGPWMLRTVTSFARRLWTGIPALLGG